MLPRAHDLSVDVGVDNKEGDEEQHRVTTSNNSVCLEGPFVT